MIDFVYLILSMIEIIYGLIVLNIATAALAAYLWRKAKLPSDRPESIELQEFMMDLMAGQALILVKRIAPTDIVIRARRK